MEAEPCDRSLPEIEPMQQSGVHFTERDNLEKSCSIILYLKERGFCYEAGLGRRVKLLPPDAPIPELACEPDQVWDVWEFNADDESLSKV